MNSIVKAPLSNAARLLLVAFVVVGAIRVIDFAFYGYQPHNALSAVGFALMAYGLYRNGFEKVAVNSGGRYASLAGVILVLVSLTIRYLG